MANYPRPNPMEMEDIRLESRIRLIDINTMLNKEIKLKQLICDKYDEIINDDLYRMLDSISVKNFQLHCDGITSRTLERNGIFSLLDLYKSLLESYDNIPGVVSYKRVEVEDYIYEFKTSLKDTIDIRFDLEEKDSKQEELLKLLLELRLKENIYKKLEDYIHKYKKNIEKSFKFLKTGIFWTIKWLFMSNRKQKKVIDSLYINKEFLKNLNLKEVNNILEEKEKEIESIDIWEDFKKNSADYYALLENILGRPLGEEEKGNIEEGLLDSINSIELDESSLKVKLRSWQTFAAKYTIHQKKVLIGDEMGLGKTVEALAVMSHLKGQGQDKFLVLCPASIIINWYKETEKHTSLKAFKLHGRDRDEELKKWLEEGGVAITSYETAQVLNYPLVFNLDLLVLDEAHYVKNPEAKRSKFAYKLTELSMYTIYMTGTPIENELSEMLILMDQLNPELVEDLMENPSKFSGHIFKKAISPVYLRRNRKDVLKELPDLSQIDVWTEFSPLEEKDYIEKLREGNFMGMRRSGFAGGTRQNSGKLARIHEIVEESLENKSKLIIFSFFRDVISILYEEFSHIAVEPIVGGLSPAKRFEILEEFNKSEEKNILIAQIDTAGQGLNIQEANTVILCEPQLKPSIEAQAISRVYRMGQVKNVFVYRILTENSIDEMLMETLKTKEYVFNTYAKESFIGEESLIKERAKLESLRGYILKKERENKLAG